MTVAAASPAHTHAEVVEVHVHALCSHMGHISSGESQLLSSRVKFTLLPLKLAQVGHLGCEDKASLQHRDWTQAV